MKKLIKSIVVITSMLVLLNSLNVYAYQSETVKHFSDGGYIVITIEDAKINPPAVCLSTTSTTKSKTYTYYNSSNVKQWYVKVTGNFTYGNGTSKCNTSTVSAGAYNSTWKISNKSARKSSNKAIATATAKHYYNGNVIDTINETVTLTCSSTGKFS